jgi:hypothetical protein
MEPYGITIFCDDIRSEALGKTMLIGVYHTDILVYGNFPAMLAKFGIYVQLRLPPIKISSFKINIYASWDDSATPIFSQELPPIPDELTNTPISTSDQDVIPTISVDVPIILSPMILKSEGHLKVRAEINGRVIKAGALKIVKSASPIV